MNTIRLVSALTAIVAFGENVPAESLEIDSVIVTLLEEVEVPAREAGVLATVAVREGDHVEQGQTLAQLDATIPEMEREQALLELEIAREHAQNDVKVRFAKKSREVAEAELRRAMESVKTFSKSVSQTELDRLRLTVDRATLEIEQAERDLVAARQAASVKEHEWRLAVHRVDRRQITAPISGIIVQVNRRHGEWVKPGDAVLRILRIGRLRAEGFLQSSLATRDLVGRAVTLSVDLPDQPGAQFPGRIIYVSPEVNPVNGQARIWAEIDNQKRRLRPGLMGRMSIVPHRTTPALPPASPTHRTSTGS